MTAPEFPRSGLQFSAVDESGAVVTAVLATVNAADMATDISAAIPLTSPRRPTGRARADS